MITHKIFMGFTVSSLLIAGMSFYDDYKHKPLSLRLIAQMVAIMVVISFGMAITRINLPFPGSDALGAWGYLITFVWILGLIILWTG